MNRYWCRDCDRPAEGGRVVHTTPPFCVYCGSPSMTEDSLHPAVDCPPVRAGSPTFGEVVGCHDREYTFDGPSMDEIRDLEGRRRVIRISYMTIVRWFLKFNKELPAVLTRLSLPDLPDPEKLWVLAANENFTHRTIDFT